MSQQYKEAYLNNRQFGEDLYAQHYQEGASPPPPTGDLWIIQPEADLWLIQPEGEFWEIAGDL